MSVAWTRRALLRLLLVFGLWAPLRAQAQSFGGRAQPNAKPADKQRPQPGDRFVFALGSRAGETVRPVHLELGARPLPAYPVDPSTGVVRSGSRLNQVVLLRLDPGTLAPKTARAAAGGIVAYSAICTHTGCDVSEWRGKSRVLVCPCHGSEFEVVNAAVVAKGPAPKPLAMLPVEISEGELRVRRGFTRRVGFQPQ